MSEANMAMTIYLLMTVTSWITFNSSINIKVVNVIDMIITKESLNSVTDKNMMIEA